MIYLYRHNFEPLMMTYSELHKLKIAFNNKYDAWEKDLFNAALDLHNLLKKQLNPPEEVLVMKSKNDEELRWHPVMLEQPFYDANKNGDLICTLLHYSNYKDLIRDDGSLPFSISLNFPSAESYDSSSPLTSVLGNRIHLNVRFIDRHPMYAISHHVSRESCSGFMSKEEILKRIMEIFLESVNFDPYSGKEKPQFGFNVIIN
jgi:hypothetical protein